jgi:hypothetical protein
MKRSMSHRTGTARDARVREELPGADDPFGSDGGRTIYDEESYADARINEFAESGSDTYGRKADDIDEEEDEAGNRSYWTDRGKDRA